MAFTVYDWLVANHATTLGRAVIRMALCLDDLPVISTVVNRRLVNSLECERLVQAMPRIGLPTVGGFRRSGEVVSELAVKMNLQAVVMSGNLAEQDEFLRDCSIKGLVQLDPAENTPAQVKATLDWLRDHDVEQFVCFTHETLLVRAVLTFVREMNRRGELRRIYPFGNTEPDRIKLSPAVIEAGTIYEAFRLRRHQIGGNVATFQEMVEYLQRLRRLPVKPVATLCAVF